MRISFCCLKFCFPARFVLYINCSVDKGCIHHRFWCRFKKQQVSLDVSVVCSEPFAVLKLAVGLLNICTIYVITGWKPGRQFWCEFVTEWPLQKILLLANVKLWIALTPSFGLDWEGSAFFQLCLDVWIRTYDVNFMKSQFFQKNFRSELMPYLCLTVFATWFLDLPMILPKITSRASRTITISVSLREVRQFAKNFSFKVAWN